MVESTALQHEGSDVNIDAAQSQKRIVLTIGDRGHGKSTFNNALIGAHKNRTSDDTVDGTQDFQMHNSILSEFQDTIFIDSPALNDLDTDLQSWIAKYNKTIGQQNAQKLSLLVLLVQFQSRPTFQFLKDLDTLLIFIKELGPHEFTVVFNKCSPRFTVSKAIDLLNERLQALEDKLGQSILELTEQQVLLIHEFDEEEVEQIVELIENTIRPQVVKFVSETLKRIMVGSDLNQSQTTLDKKWEDEYRKALLCLKEKIAEQEKIIEDLNIAIQKAKEDRYNALESLNRALREAKQLEQMLKATKNQLEMENELKQKKINDQANVISKLEQNKRQNEEQILHLKNLLERQEEEKKELLFKIKKLTPVHIKDYTYSNAKYTGYMLDGKENGYGTMRWNNGDVYDGNWRYGEKSGFGKKTSHDGDMQEGEWKNDELHYGIVKETHSNGVYQGEKKSGKRHGQGKYSWNDGAVYDGQWRDGQKHGIAVYTSGEIVYNFLGGGCKEPPYRCVWSQGKLEKKL